MDASGIYIAYHYEISSGIGLLDAAVAHRTPSGGDRPADRTSTSQGVTAMSARAFLRTAERAAGPVPAAAPLIRPAAPEWSA